MAKRITLGGVLGVLLALFMVGAASALEVENKGQGTSHLALDPLPLTGDEGPTYTLNNAHGPTCDDGAFVGDLIGAPGEVGDCENSNGGNASPSGQSPGGLVLSFDGGATSTNVGAWNGYFQSCAKSDGNSAVIGAEGADPQSDLTAAEGACDGQP